MTPRADSLDVISGHANAGVRAILARFVVSSKTCMAT